MQIQICSRNTIAVDCGSSKLKQLSGYNAVSKLLSGSFCLNRSEGEAAKVNSLPAFATEPLEAQTDNLPTMLGSDFAIKLHI